MMRKINLILAVVLTFLSTGCFNVYEELSLNQDGSGTYIIKMDLSQFISDDFMKNMLKEAMDQEASVSGLGDMEQDSLIEFKNISKELKNRTGKPEFWDNVSMRLKISDKDDEFFTQTTLKFKNIKDIDFFHKHLNTMLSENGAGGLMVGDILPGGASYRLEKNMLTRLPAEKGDKEEMEGEEMEMFKMLMGESKYTMVYKLPGAVKKTTIPGANISGSTVKVETDLLSMMEGKGEISGNIIFK